MFISILNMSITAGIVALAVMLIRIPLRKAPKIFSYALWGVVLFRLIFPFGIESIFGLMPAGTTNAIPQDIVVIHSPEIPQVIVFSQAPTIQTEQQSISTTISPENNVNSIRTTLEIAGYIWLAGFTALLLYAVIGYIRLKRRVHYATLVCGNIFETDKIKTPFVLGFIRPKIYFPTTIDPSRHDYILKHEQTHIKRRDYIIKPFAYIVLALHWFNPLIWLSYYLMSKDMEMSCDEAVLRKTSEDIRGNYSTSLLNLSAGKVNLLNPIAFAFGESNVKERVTNVLNFKKPAKWVVIASALAVAVFLVAFTSNRVALAEEILNEDSIAYISDDFSFDIPYIPPAGTVLIGRIELEPGDVFNRSVSAEVNGGNLLIGISLSSENEGNWLRGNWLELNNNTNGQWQFATNERITAYLYLVSGSNMHQWGMITNITGSIIRQTASLSESSNTPSQTQLPLAQNTTQSDARRIAVSLMDNYEWHGNMENIIQIGSRDAYGFIFVNYDNDMSYFIAVDADTGEVIYFESMEHENIGWNLWGLWSLFMDAERAEISSNAFEQGFIPPLQSDNAITMNHLTNGMAERTLRDFGVVEELGVTSGQEGNIYYRGRLLRSVILYRDYEENGHQIIINSSDAGSNLLAYVRVDASWNAISLNVVEEINADADESAKAVYVTTQSEGLRQTIQIDIPIIYASSYIIGNVVFIDIELETIYPGDVITIDTSTDAQASAFVGLSNTRTTGSLEGQTVFITGAPGGRSGTFTMEGDATYRYLFVFVQSDNVELIDTYFSGTIIIERQNSPALSSAMNN